MKHPLMISIAVVVVAIAAIVTVISLPREAPQPTDTQTEATSRAPTVVPSPVPTPAASFAVDDVKDRGEALVIPFVAAESTAREDTDTPLSFQDVATGSALEDLQISALEFAESGLKQVGEPTVVSAEITDSDDAHDPPQVTVLVCLDYSDVDVVGTTGKSVKESSAPQRIPTLLILENSGDAWLVSHRTFPAETTC